MLSRCSSACCSCRVQDFEPPRFHMFYGFVAFISVGLLYSYKYVWKARGWMELAYGLGGLFIMGLGIRAILQVRVVEVRCASDRTRAQACGSCSSSAGGPPSTTCRA